MVHLNKGLSLNWAIPQVSRRTGNQSSVFKASNRLVSIILATKSSRGESIAFHYPAEIDSRILSHAHRHGEDPDIESDVEEEYFVPAPGPEIFDRRPDGHLPTIQERETSQDDVEDHWIAPWRTILGLDSALLADILTPQVSDHKFEMWMDNLVFLGCPIQLKSRGAWDIGDADIMKDDMTHARLGHSANHPEKGLAASTKDEAKHEEDNSIMTTFHVVFAMDASIDDSYHKHLSALYDNVVRQLTIALAHEQVETDYVWTQCETMRNLRRRGEKNRTNTTSLWQDMIHECDLARIIKDTFDAVSNNEIAHLMINNKRPLSIFIPHSMTTDSIPADTITQHPFLNSAVSFGISMEEADPTILPYYALLLLEDADRILKALPAPTSSQLTTLVHEISPQKDFYVLAESLQMPVQEIITMAQDLIRWRCALPIPPLHERNIYTLSPTADKSRLPQQIPLFARAFPSGPPLPKMLADLSLSAMPYANMIPEGHLTIYMEMLAWLMRSGWLIQLRTFVSIKVRAEIKVAVTKATSGGPTTHELEDDEAVVDSIIADPYNANELESMWLEKLASYHPVADAALFLRACKYFNGKHAVEKIAVRDGIDPRSLRRLLDVFDEDLIKSYSW